MHIRQLQPNDLQMLARHQFRHTQENGQGLIFTPSEEGRQPTPEDLAKMAEALAKPATEKGWSRTWILTDETEVFGEITIVNRPPLKAALHRCLLMMGIEGPQRGQGWGSKLMNEAINWAKQQPSLDWITLHVFENNSAAKALYKKHGFVATGTTTDMFRVFGQSIDNTEMVLPLR